jgi:hypothetical protein
MLKQVQHDDLGRAGISRLAPQRSKLLGCVICKWIARAAYTSPLDQSQTDQEATVRIDGLLHRASSKQFACYFQLGHSWPTLNEVKQPVRNISHQ